MTLVLKNLLFTIVVPGSAAVLVPGLLTLASPTPDVVPSTKAIAVMGLGVALYGWCLWNFATVGRGTPGPWDPPRNFVATGPYRWVRNPMYIGVMLVIGGWAWLYASMVVLAYLVIFFAIVNVFVIFYEEPNLNRLFGTTYAEYARSVWRWIPTLPKPAH